MKRPVLTVLFMALICAPVYFVFFGGGPGEEALIRVEKGESAKTVAQKLKEQGVIPSTYLFLALARAAGSIHYGPYRLEKNRTWDTVRKLTRGQTYRVKVSIPEGWSAFQTAQRLAAEGVIADATSFAAMVDERKLEGRLFPSTYFLEPGSDNESVLKFFLAQFDKACPPEMGVSSAALALASIIEREAAVDDERPVISSVYRNRLKKRMALEADPTVQYAIGKGRTWKERILYKDLKVKSPYNTYLNRGLPPGPICSPGLASIRAALNPAETPYLYFVADGTGRHQFFKDHRSHILWQKQNRKKRRTG
ncbi:MAG: hypothetical protein A3A86_05270 [Elusimicrobia bacterium RIFCSPLOWO2_01_FULL_60_11]|nr:MAG: hypothetical protein A3A86_05270 [Elusimicrobia bacterium RIFCSPLOWO2_01_FULL_60_11]